MGSNTSVRPLDGMGTPLEPHGQRPPAKDVPKVSESPRKVGGSEKGAASRIIPGLGPVVRITPIYKPQKGHLEGERLYLGDENDHHGDCINHKSILFSKYSHT